MKPGIREKNTLRHIDVKLTLERESVCSLTVGLLAIPGKYVAVIVMEVERRGIPLERR